MPLPSTVSNSSPARPTVLSSLSSSCLRFLAEHVDASGSGVRDGLGMRHLSQTSRMLARLERDGLVERHRGGRENHWHLTDRGQAVLKEQDPIWSVQDGPVVRPGVETNPSKGALL
jgi:DNA-binding MarR family transcriptional regulator